MNKDNIDSPTPYNEINSVIQIFLEKVRTILGDYFMGLYLYGSLAGGDFDPNRSDIDFLVVTKDKLPESLISELEKMHLQLNSSECRWLTRLEGAYIPMDAVRVYSPTGPACPLVNKNEFLVACPESDWVINRYILYTRGVVITGAPLQIIIDPVQPEQLREAVLTLLGQNWMPWSTNAALFRSDEYQPYVVLTMCRALYTLRHGTVVSKLQSAEWIIANSDQRWTNLIKQALDWHYGEPVGDIGQTQEFIRYTLKEAGLTKKI